MVAVIDSLLAIKRKGGAVIFGKEGVLKYQIRTLSDYRVGVGPRNWGGSGKLKGINFYDQQFLSLKESEDLQGIDLFLDGGRGKF